MATTENSRAVVRPELDLTHLMTVEFVTVADLIDLVERISQSPEKTAGLDTPSRQLSLLCV